jgi:hypothetical protein
MVNQLLPRSSRSRVPRPDDLLEQRHRLDVLVQHDELAGLGVDARAHQLGRGGDHRVGLLGVDEVVELALALGVVAGDLHHVVGLAGAEVGVGVAQRLAHAGGVLDVFAEDDGLVVAVRGLQVFGDLGGHHLVAALQHQLAVHVRAGVDPVFDDVAQLVGHALGRAPAEGVLVQVDADHLVGAPGSRLRCPGAGCRCRRARRSSRCWRRRRSPWAWRSGRSAWRC